MTDLAPCPFCGGPGVLSTSGPPWRVTCTTCGATGPERRCLSHAERLWGARSAPVADDERAAVLAFLERSVTQKLEHIPHQDTSSQRAVSQGQVRQLKALMRDIRAGKHVLNAQGILEGCDGGDDAG